MLEEMDIKYNKTIKVLMENKNFEINICPTILTSSILLLKAAHIKLIAIVLVNEFVINSYITKQAP